MMTSEDCEAVMAAAMSYRPGALMTVHDIRVAAAADGHPLDHASGSEIAAVLRYRGLRPVRLDGPNGKAEHFCHWIREAD
jgi:hypothetical protein